MDLGTEQTMRRRNYGRWDQLRANKVWNMRPEDNVLYNKRVVGTDELLRPSARHGVVRVDQQENPSMGRDAGKKWEQCMVWTMSSTLHAARSQAGGYQRALNARHDTGRLKQAL